MPAPLRPEVGRRDAAWGLVKETAALLLGVALPVLASVIPMALGTAAS